MTSTEMAIVLQHRGAINGPIIAELLDDLDFKCINLDISDVKRRKIFNIAVEMFQNLYHYTRDLKINGYDETELRSIFLSLDILEDSYILITSNHIKNQDIDSLRKKIDFVNKLDVKEIRAFYKKILSNEEFSEKGGAGLGFIDMKKRSGSPLEYKIEKIDETISKYTLVVKVEK